MLRSNNDGEKVMPPSSSTRIINAVAPIRICDLGGWTDT